MTSFDDLLSQVSITSVFCVVALCFLVRRVFSAGKNGSAPPSAPNIPFFGSLPFIGIHAEKTFSEWAKKYGPIFHVKLGPHDTVVLNSYELIQQAFVKEASCFSGRFHTFFSKVATNGDYGIIFLNDPDNWKTQRRFGSRALSGASLHGRTLETRVVDEAKVLCEHIRSNEGKPFVFEPDLAMSIANVIHEITMNERVDGEGNNGIKEHVKTLLEGFRNDGFFWMMLTVAPWCRHFPYVRKKYSKLVGDVQFNDECFNKMVQKHEREQNLSQPSDFVDMFLVEEKRGTASFTRPQLIRYLQDLAAAGTETSTSTLRWILLHLIKQPKIQEKVHEEIDRVVGRAGKLSLNADLPYVKAVIQEAFRVETPVPLSVPRKTREDVQLMGFTIPKNTQIISNIWHVHNDPDLWPDPRRFDPERHLDKNGRFVKSDKVIPFSIGPRNCLGENLARIEIFLFLVSILQKFKVLPNSDQSEPCMEGTPGPVYSAFHYPMIFEER